MTSVMVQARKFFRRKKYSIKKIIVETTDLSNFVENEYEIIKIDVEGSS